MSKFLDQTGLSHFWSKIKTLLAGKADKSHTHTSINNDLYISGDINVDGEILNGGQPFTDYVDAACSGVYDLVSKEKADAGHTHTGYASSSHNHALSDLNVPHSQTNTSYVARPYMGLLRACRTFALPSDQVIVEQSTDGGATWTDAGYTDWTKAQIFSQTRLGSFQIPLKNGSKSCDCMLRVTITGMKYNVPEGTAETEKYNYWNSNYAASTERYCSLDFGYFWISADIEKMYIEHQVATGAYPNSWVSDGLLNKAQGWTGGDYVKFNGNTFGGDTSQIYNYWNHRFIFRTQASDGSFDDSKLDQSYLTKQQAVYEISCYGQNCWTPANEMMNSDRPYTVNNSNQTTFTGDVVVQGAMYPQGYVVPQTDVYGQGQIYAKGGFVFTGQSDADKKLLRADGWWQHVDTFATADHTHDSFNGNLYVDGVLDADAGICIGGEYLHDIFAEANHTHTEYTTKTYVDGQISNTEGLIQYVDDRVTALEQSSGSTSSASHKFQLLGRQTLAANGVADLSTFLSAYDELMIIVRTQSSASVTIGPANNTSGSSGFLCSKSLSGTQYTKIMVNKTNEGYMAWDVGGSIGWTNSTTYKYLRNYVASGTVSMSVVVHGR